MALIVALERFANDGVDVALHRQQRLDRLRGAQLRDHRHDPVAEFRDFLPLVALQILTQPSAGRANSGKKQNSEPEVIAVPIQEGAFSAVDIGCRSGTNGERGILVSVRLLDLGRARHFPGHTMASAKRLPGERGDGAL
jgi:hypothetical protein